MADQYLAGLNDHERRQKYNISIYEMDGGAFLNYIKGMAGQPMSDNDYAKVQEMFYRRYMKKEDRKAAMNYCIMQAQRLSKARSHKYMRSMFPRISFNQPVAEFFPKFLAGKEDLYGQMEQTIMKKWVVAISVMAVLILALFVLLFRWSFMVSWLICFVFFILMYFVGDRYVTPVLIQDRMEHMIKTLDPVHMLFERKMPIKAPAFLRF